MDKVLVTKIEAARMRVRRKPSVQVLGARGAAELVAAARGRARPTTAAAALNVDAVLAKSAAARGQLRRG